MSSVSPKKKSKAAPIIASVVALLIVGALATWLLWSGEKPNPAVDVVANAAKSRDYASVVKAMDRGELTQDQVRKAVQGEFESQTIIHVNSYFDTKDPKAKQAELDKAIDDLERFRAVSRANAAKAATRPGTRPASRPNTDAMQAAMKLASWALSQPPDTRARLAEYRVAFDKRRAERGLPGMFDGGASVPLGQK